MGRNGNQLYGNGRDLWEFKIIISDRRPAEGCLTPRRTTILFCYLDEVQPMSAGKARLLYCTPITPYCWYLTHLSRRDIRSWHSADRIFTHPCTFLSASSR